MTPVAFLRGETASSALARGANNLGLTRLALALAVVLSHAFSIPTGHTPDEPLAPATGFTLGEHAVNGFFAVSGFLVAMSFETRGWRDYAVARALRIVPGFAVATLFVAFAIGGALTALPLAEYLRHPGLWRFLTATLTSFKSAIALPGVFAANGFPYPMAPVWTLKYEVLCYLGLLACGLAGLLRRRSVALLVPAGCFAALLALLLMRGEVTKGVETALRLPLIFSTGACLYLWRDVVRLSFGLLAGAIGLVILARHTALYQPLLFATEAYGALVLGLGTASDPRFNPRADLSYGIYLYGWPIQQALQAVYPGGGAALLCVAGTGLAVLAAFLSWHLVERPALALKAALLRARAPNRTPSGH